MELFQDVASEEEFAGIAGLQPGSPQIARLKEHLKANHADNAECLCWLYTLRGDSQRAEEVLKAVPEERRGALKMRMNLVAGDVARQIHMMKTQTQAKNQG